MHSPSTPRPNLRGPGLFRPQLAITLVNDRGRGVRGQAPWCIDTRGRGRQILTRHSGTGAPRTERALRVQLTLAILEVFAAECLEFPRVTPAHLGAASRRSAQLELDALAAGETFTRTDVTAAQLQAQIRVPRQRITLDRIAVTAFVQLATEVALGGFAILTRDSRAEACHFGIITAVRERQCDTSPEQYSETDPCHVCKRTLARAAASNNRHELE